MGVSNFDNGILYQTPRKRNVFFSFHYADIMRVNVVRLSGEFKTPEQPYGSTSIEGFYDKSLWESRKLSGDDSLKNLIRDGVKNTSVVCVLAGTSTWQRRWVRYEIARSVIDGKGLVTIHINSIKHHQPPYQSHDRGDDPTRYLGIAAHPNGNFYLCERFHNGSGWAWRWYEDYTSPVDVPQYMTAPILNQPVRLSEVTVSYDWSQNGHQNVGGWIDLAAREAGR
jgi:hypothetical protein